jgi:heptosyltransferase-2
MHASIALKKHVLAWFGLSCWEEIDLYDRGRKFHAADLDCSPCWRRECPNNLECIDRIDLEGMAEEILRQRDAGRGK